MWLGITILRLGTELYFWLVMAGEADMLEWPPLWPMRLWPMCLVV